MSTASKKLKLNIQTVRQLTNREATHVVGGDTGECDVTHDLNCAPPIPSDLCNSTVCPTNSCQTWCGGCATVVNQQCCADGGVSNLRWDF